VNENQQPVEVLLVCTGGGHLLQLWSLRAAWTGYSHAWVVGSHEGSDVASLLEHERVYHAHPRAARSLKKLFLNLLLARRLLSGLRPRVVLTTGAAVAVPFAWLARLYGIRVVWVESLARAKSPSLSCRLVAPIADRIYVQWPELVGAVRRSRYAGTVFSP
jgi:beta-1,4-N-acetylglucosaminyltransferase